jgi:hypothetical protein
VSSNIYITPPVAHLPTCLRPVSLFAISLPPFRNLGLCGYETSFRQFHSRLFPDRRFFYSSVSFELEERVVCGQGEPKDGGDSHEKGFEGQCLFTEQMGRVRASVGGVVTRSGIDSPEEWRVDMCQRCGSDAKCCPLGSTLLSAEVEQRKGMRPDSPQRSVRRNSPGRTHPQLRLTRNPALTWIRWATSASF